MGNYGTAIQAAIATQIRAEMAAKGWKQAELAKRAGLNVSTLHRYLSGERDIPLPVFAELAGVLDLTYIELAGRAQRRLDGEDVL